MQRGWSAAVVLKAKSMCSNAYGASTGHGSWPFDRVATFECVAAFPVIA